MEGLTDYITRSDWENILTVTFVLIDDAWPTLPKEALPRLIWTVESGRMVNTSSWPCAKSTRRSSGLKESKLFWAESDTALRPLSAY